jgi:hypothetical protein
MSRMIPAVSSSCARGHASGRIRREIQVEQFRALAQQRLELVRAEREAVLFAKVKRHGLRAQVADEGLVDRKARARVDDVIAGVAVDLLRESDRRLGAGEDDHAVRGDLQPALFADRLGDGHAQRLDALRIDVMRLIEVDLPFDFFSDVPGQREVGFADVAADDALSKFFNFADPGADLERVLRAQRVHTACEWRCLDRLQRRHVSPPPCERLFPLDGSAARAVLT